MILKQGILPIIVELANKNAPYFILRSCIWCIGNLCRGRPCPILSLVMPAFKKTSEILSTQNDERLIIDAAWTLYYLSDGGYRNLLAMKETGIIPTLVKFLSNPEEKIIIPCLRIVGNISLESDDLMQIAIDLGCMPALKKIIQSSSRVLRKDCCWVISNIAAGTPVQLKQLILEDIISFIPIILKKDDLSVKREALWIIRNMTKKMEASFIDYIINSGVIQALSGLMPITDVKLLSIVLHIIQNCLKKTKEKYGNCDVTLELIERTGCLNLLEELQFHKNQIIYNLAIKIIKNYVDVEQIDDMLGDIQIRAGHIIS